MRITPAILVTASLACLTSAANAQSLPNGAAKDVVQSACSACHQLNVVTNAGHTPDEWNRIVGEMVIKGAAVSAAQVPVLTQYLASNFPPRARPQGAVVTGSAQASFREWQIPSRPFPHDPYAAADGSLWYSGMARKCAWPPRSKIGSVQGISTERQRPLDRTALSATAPAISGSRRIIAVISASSTQRPARSPNTRFPAAAIRTRLCSTSRASSGSPSRADNLIGRLDPSSGEVKTVPVPTQGALPYGMVVSSKGVPFFAEFGSNKIASIDPKTMQITEYTLPNRNSQPRRIAITSDDVLVVRRLRPRISRKL